MTFVVVPRLFKLVLVFSCNSLKFGSLGISLSVGIGSVERILLLMSTSARAYSFSSGVDLSVALRVERAALDLGKTPFVCKF